MVLFYILVGTVLAGVGSVWLAALLSYGALRKYTAHMLSLSAGALLATAFMHLLPEAFLSRNFTPNTLFMVLLGGLVLFFLLDKAELWHHGHEHASSLPTLDEAMEVQPSTPHAHTHAASAGHTHTHASTAPHAHTHSPAAAHGHAHAHAHAHGADERVHGYSHANGSKPANAHEVASAGHGHHHSGAWSILTGDGVHCFGDGVLIASAFMADVRLGIMAAVAVLAHEVPHHMGDLAVLTHGKRDRRTALLKVSLAGCLTALGGLVGYVLVDKLEDWLPLFLVLASSSFIYVALADLIPQLQKKWTLRETGEQLLWLGIGIAIVTAASMAAHSHHDHGHDHAHDHEATESESHQHAVHDEHEDHDHDHDHDNDNDHRPAEGGAQAAAGSGVAAPVPAASDVEATAPLVQPEQAASDADPAAVHDQAHGSHDGHDHAH